MVMKKYLGILVLMFSVGALVMVPASSVYAGDETKAEAEPECD